MIANINIEELIAILSHLGIFGLGVLVGGIIIGYLLKSFLPSYLSEKGKNLATREDVGRITEEIEKVKSQYNENLQNLIHQNNLILEEVRGRHQLRLAALDRRLQAHQEAFTLWKKLLWNVYKDSIGDIVIECQDWWEKNCLYLSAEAREAFSKAYHSAFIHQSYLQDRTNAQLIEDNFRRIKYAGERIVKGAELPSLGDRETEIIPLESNEPHT